MQARNQKDFSKYSGCLPLSANGSAGSVQVLGFANRNVDAAGRRLQCHWTLPSRSSEVLWGAWLPHLRSNFRSELRRKLVWYSSKGKLAGISYISDMSV
jgi:hypothetical protein